LDYIMHPTSLQTLYGIFSVVTYLLHSRSL
jgi:hypothetical protein